MSEEQQVKESNNLRAINLEKMISVGSQKLAALIGLKLLAVVEINRQENGDWLLKLEFVEREGIPNTMDLIGLYEAGFDKYGQLLNYSRQNIRKRGDSYN